MFPFQISPSKPCVPFSSDMRATCPVYLILLTRPKSDEQYKSRSSSVDSPLPPPATSSAPHSRDTVLSFKLGGWHSNTNVHNRRLICVLCSGHDTVCCPCTGPEHFAVKAQISLSLSVPDCGWWGSSQEYAAFCIQPTRSAWLLWHWGSCKFAWVHRLITLSAEWGGYDIGHVHLVAAYCDHCSEYNEHLRQWALSNITLW